MSEPTAIRIADICLRLKILTDELAELAKAENKTEQLAVITGKASAIVEDLELEWVAARDSDRIRNHSR